jgi:pyruvate-formate lyase-activating enzyme
MIAHIVHPAMGPPRQRAQAAVADATPGMDLVSRGRMEPTASGSEIDVGVQRLAIQPARSRLETLTREYALLRPMADERDLPQSDFSSAARTYEAMKRLNDTAVMTNRALGALRLRAMPQAVQLNNTAACNLRCPQCNTHGTDAAHAFNQSPAQTMSAAMIAEIAHATFPYARQVSLSGTGEGLLHRELDTIITLAHRYGVRILVNSNGTTAVKKRLRRLFGTAHLRISIDGATPATFEAIRRGASFAKVMRNVRVVTRANELLPPSLRLPIDFHFGICASNVRDMPLMVDLAAFLGVDGVIAFPILPHVKAYAEDGIDRCPAYYKYYFQQALQRVHGRSFTISYPEPAADVAADPTARPILATRFAPDLPDSYYTTLPPFEELIDLGSLEEAAGTLAEAALEAGIERLAGSPRAETATIVGDVEARTLELKERLRADFASLTPAELERLGRMKDSERPMRLCHWLPAHLYFNPDGSVTPCCQKGMIDVGNVGTSSVPEIFNGSIFAELIRRFHSDDPLPACRECPLWETRAEREIFSGF